jgi:pilus assembly protein CpaE
MSAPTEQQRIRVVVIDDVASTVESLTKLLSFEADMEVVGSALNAETGISEVRRLGPDVVLMDVNMPGQDGIKATEQMSLEPPHAPVVLMSVQEDKEYLRRAMQAGAREFLVKPFSGAELASALRRVHQLEQVKRIHAAPPDQNGSAAEASHKGQVIVVFSGKGGVGKSMLSLNLAAALARDVSGRVGLVDFDLQFGDLGVLLGLDAGRNVSQVVDAFPNIDADFVEALMPEASGGFKVLLGPQSPELADLVSADHARTILEVLAASFDYVVVDTSSHLGEVTLEALERGSTIIVIVELSLPAVKEAKLALRVFERLGIKGDRIRVVLNRSDANSGITLDQIESTLAIKLAGRLPSDGKTVLKSVQRAEPFVVLFPEADISQSVRELVGSLLRSRAAEGSRAPRQARKASFWPRP